MQKNNRSYLTRTKSTSNEDIHLAPERDKTKSTEDLEDLEQLQDWRRTAKIRRSFQLPNSKPVTSTKPSDLPENKGNVKKIREDLETGRRLSTALRNNSVDLEALDQILQSISSTSSVFSDNTNNENENEKLNVERLDKNETFFKSKTDRNSFSTQSNFLRDLPLSIRDRLKNGIQDIISPDINHLGENEDTEKSPDSPNQIIVKKQKRNSFVTVESIQEVRGRLRRTSSPSSDIYRQQKEDIDDGIVEDNKQNESPKMEPKVKSYVYGMEKKPVTGTGSLESRSKQLNNLISRSEEWYNRRKSYGFEQVHNPSEQSLPSKINKNKVDISTDSGICRSTEIVVVPSSVKLSDINKSSEFSSESDLDDKKPSGISEVPAGSVKRFSSFFDQMESAKKPSWRDWQNNEVESTTIRIPIGAKNSSAKNTGEYL